MKNIFATLAALLAISTAFAVKITNGPYQMQVGENEATLVWSTDVPAVSWVEIAPCNGSHFYESERPRFYDSPFGKKRISKLHKVRVSGLEKGKKYNFRVFSREVVKQSAQKVFYGDVASTKVFHTEPPTISTFDNSKPSLRFTVVNDIHGDSKMLKKFLADSIEDDFIMLNGDMVSKMDSAEELFSGFLDEVVASTKSSKPILYARGNHETRGEFAGEFVNMFPTDTGKPYFAKKIGPAFFIFLDSGEDKPDNDIEYYGTADYDKYRAEQGEWLKGVLESPEFKSAPMKIVVVHIPPAWGSWHGSVDFRKVFAPILNGKDIDLVLSGHLHKHEFYPANKNGFDMPVIANSNKEAMKVVLTKNSVDVKFVKPDGGEARPAFSIKK